MFLNLNCKHCNQIYVDAVVLPCCKRSVCLKHIQITSKSKFKCFLCNENIQLPIYSFRYDNRAIKAFILLFMMLIMLSARLLAYSPGLDLNDVFTYGSSVECLRFKQSCQQLSETLQNSETIVRGSDSYIHEYFDQVRADLAARKRQAHLEVENSYMKNMNELEQLEKECIKSNEISKKREIFAEQIKLTRDKLKKWNEDFLNINPSESAKNDAYLNLVGLRVEQETDKLKEMIMNLQNELLLYQDYEFKHEEKISLGEITVKKRQKSDVNKPEAAFRLVIKDFDEFKKSKYLYESIQPCLIRSIPWRLQAQLEETSNYDIGISVYVRPDLNAVSLSVSPVKAEIILKLISKQPEYTRLYLKGFTHTFIDNSGKGFSPFIHLRDVMDVKKGFLNDNSITIEAFIRIIKVY